MFYTVSNMFTKIKTWVLQSRLKALGDSRNIGLGIFSIIALSVTWSGVKVVQANYRLQKQIVEAEQQTALQELENKNFKLRTEYLKSDQYLELSARRLFNRAAPGEQLIIVPKEVALTYTPALPTSEPVSDILPANTSTPWYGDNIQAWIDFFMGRKPVD